MLESVLYCTDCDTTKLLVVLQLAGKPTVFHDKKTNATHFKIKTLTQYKCESCKNEYSQYKDVSWAINPELFDGNAGEIFTLIGQLTLVKVADDTSLNIPDYLHHKGELTLLRGGNYSPEEDPFNEAKILKKSEDIKIEDITNDPTTDTPG